MNGKGIKEKFAKLFDEPNRVTFKQALNNLVGEYDDLEFKRQEIPYHDLAKHIIGMANTNGGIIFLGIEETDRIFKPIGLENNTDPTDMKNGLSKYLPHNLFYEIHSFDYDENEGWGDIKNKSFKLITIEYTPENIPFLPKKASEDYDVIDIFCRKNSSTNKCGYEDLQDIFENRINSNKLGFDLKNELRELEILTSYKNYQKFFYLSLYNPHFLDLINDFEKRKVKYIENGLKINDIDCD